MSRQCATAVFSRAIKVAGGVFAPGHLGELTQHVPFELVDDVLTRTRTVEERRRLLPSRVGVYFLLALAMFPVLGYARVWDKLTAGLGPLTPVRPSEKALRDLRRRLGPAPLKMLFETLAGPVAQPATAGVRYRRWRTVAVDGCSSIKAPDQPRIRRWLGKICRQGVWDGYPMLRLTALCETGTRSLIGAVFGPTSCGELGYAVRLLPLLKRDMLLLADRGFASDGFLAKVADTGAHLLIRLKKQRTPAVLAALSDGSYLTRINGRKLRIIEADITLTTSEGQRTGDCYLLATTLLDHRTDPATALVSLYHERWEVESAFYALRHTLLRGLVLRSGDPFGLAQEMWAQLALYQVLRRAMTEAAESEPGTDPDRVSFTVALEAARSQVITAENILPDHTGPGVIARAVLEALLPRRRTRVSARRVKSTVVRYRSNPTDERPLSSRNITHLAITIHTAGTSQPPTQTARDQPASLPASAANGRRDRALQLLRTDPHRAWKAKEIIHALGIDHGRSLCAQLGHWVKEGILHKAGHGRYALTEEWIGSTPIRPAEASMLTSPSTA
ncbi:IS4 family transposase [Streptomyces sp. NPDC001667]